MNKKLLVFGSANFNNSIEEIKEDLGFSLIFYNFSKPQDFMLSSILAIIVDSQIYNDIKNLKIVKKNEIFNKKPSLFIKNNNIVQYHDFIESLSIPVTFSELKIKIINIVTAHKFISNSSFKIKDYILNKNEKKLIKSNKFIFITEKEAKLIELFTVEKKPLSKNFILKKIWNYSDRANTHTVETHIYRLRKKILSKFNDDNFIINTDIGYSI